MSNLSLIFQDRANLVYAGASYSPIASFADLANSTSVAHEIVLRQLKSEVGIGLQLAALDVEIFKSKEISADDITFLKNISTKFNKKNPIKLK
jgi:hypothetical protein